MLLAKEGVPELNRGQGGPFPEAKDVRLRQETIVMMLAVLVIAAALPYAVKDTLQTGRVYLFSREFLKELPQRFTGPGRFRFILQPMFAILQGVRGGLADARGGKPSLSAGWRSLRRSWALAMPLDPGACVMSDAIYDCGLGPSSAPEYSWSWPHS